MSWFGGSSAPPAPPPPAASKDGGFIAPDRTARAQCWDGRDSFFKCLDRHSIIDSVREDKKAKEVCAPELREFESACASSWVSTLVLGAGESS
jgi:cytochrome c oxidase assembly factor 6